MSQSPEEIRAQIENTRGRLSSDVDAVAEKVSPSAIAHRQTEKIRSSVGRVREQIMGVAEDATDAAHHLTGDARDSAGKLPERVTRGTQGNPLAAGLVAFGVGMLLSSLVPASEAEKHAAVAVKEEAQPLLDQAQDMAKSIASDLKEPAEAAVQQVKDAAQDSMEHLKEEGAAAADDVKDRAQTGQAHVKDAAADRSGSA